MEKVCVLRLDLRSNKGRLRSQWKKKLRRQVNSIMGVVDTTFIRGSSKIKLNKKLGSWQIYLIPKNRRIAREKLEFETTIFRDFLRWEGWKIDKWQDIYFTKNAFLKGKDILANDWEPLYVRQPRHAPGALRKLLREKERRGEELSRWEYDILHKNKWRVLRKKVLERDSYRCRLCGQSHGGEIAKYQKSVRFSFPDKSGRVWLDVLHVHHITPLTDGGSEKLSNLITLCKRCHLSLVGDVEFHPQVREILQIARRRKREDRTDLGEKLEQINSKCTSCERWLSSGCKPEKCGLPDFKLYRWEKPR